MFDARSWDHHEAVHFFEDERAGLRAIIAVHRLRTTGRAGGGIRMQPYESSASALDDVLRLSRAMTFKMALAGVPIGGAKSVILADPKTDKSRELFLAFGRAVESLGGRYLCAEDVGTRPEDMDVIAEATDHVVGRSTGSGDTTPFTALGVGVAIRAAVQRAFGHDDLAGIKVAIQGCGGVGTHLAKLLDEAGCQLWVSDVDGGRARDLADQVGAAVIAPDEIYDAEVDVFSPCALGGVLTSDTIARLRARVVCGGANNQLLTDDLASVLADRGVLYAPDYVANAGGVFSASQEYGNATADQARSRVEGIGARMRDVFDRAEQDGIPPADAAAAMAYEVLAAEQPRG